MPYEAARLSPDMLADLSRRIGYRESARWSGLVGYDRKRLEAVAKDGSRRTINANEIIFAASVETFKNDRGNDLVRVTFADGGTVETFKPYWLA